MGTRANWRSKAVYRLLLVYAETNGMIGQSNGRLVFDQRPSAAARAMAC
jgi:hypothetical protein